MIESSHGTQDSSPDRVSRARMFSTLGYNLVKGLLSKLEALGSFPIPGWGEVGRSKKTFSSSGNCEWVALERFINLKYP